MADIIFTILRDSPIKPHSLWPKIYYWIESFIGNYGWTIFIFTLFVRLIVLPLDFYNKYSTRKNTFIQKRLSGQVRKINEKCGNDKNKANQQVNALYKKEGYNMVGSCVFTLLNLVVTLVVFFSFFNSLKSISSYKMLDQYYVLEQTYEQTEGTLEDKQNAVAVKYEEIKKDSSWLWVQNIWRKDGKASVIPSYTELSKAVKSSKSYSEYIESITEEEYNNVMGGLISTGSNWNGYYILAILAGVLSYVSQLINDFMNRSKNEPKKQNNDDQLGATNKILKIVMPLIMVIFVLTSTASFGIYILSSTLIGIITSVLTSFLVNRLTRKEEEKYLAYLEKEIMMEKKITKKKPQMVNYKRIGDRLWIL